MAIVSACAGTQQRDERVWVPLFNEKDLDDWIIKVHHHETGENFGNTFRAEDGVIKVRYDKLLVSRSLR